MTDYVARAKAAIAGHDPAPVPVVKRPKAELIADAESFSREFAGSDQGVIRDYVVADLVTIQGVTEPREKFLSAGWTNAQIDGYLSPPPTRAERQAEVEAAAGGRTSAALRAEAIVNGSRNEAYGHPTPNHAKISRLWTAYLKNFLEVHGLDPALFPDLGPEDAALMMDLMKTARLQYKPFHADSVDDKVGYALCYERMGQAEKGEVQ